MNEHGFTCPSCGSSDVRRSRRQGFGEVPNMFLGVYPFRCLGCGERFFGNVWLLATRGYANCPKCLRLTVQPSVKRDNHLSAFDNFRVGLGAHVYRCIACRLTFVSFRKCVSPNQPQGTTDQDMESAQYPSSGDLG